MSKFSERLAIAMSDNQINMTALSKRTGISTATISRYLSGDFKAKQNNVYILSQTLGVKPSWLMGFDDPANIQELIDSVQGLFLSLSPENQERALDYLRYLKSTENHT